MVLPIFHERLEISKLIGVFGDLFECVTLVAGPFEELTEFIRVDTVNIHLFTEGTAIEGGRVDVVVPHQVQAIDLFDGD
ncbi:hypothetical protein JK354_17945 [Haloferax volcanii]|uniref:Uncharacterized protein n=2 Tax=Haloferax volcanii TaxID=2246 RepID=L9V0P9_HALVD|nr:hypothetical protein C498_10516 [Haloferax volcanii DS2]MBS8121005.1 hypothetical protein [Haloferax volcanii]MBS8126042.1 hypothetical protein [Haloferax volcanii]MBS8129895.1 hypothetical protein [Haloferax volcanii]MBS8133760.1 hypothetical protein [Haloferax volcanii]